MKILAEEQIDQLTQNERNLVMSNENSPWSSLQGKDNNFRKEEEEKLKEESNKEPKSLVIAESLIQTANKLDMDAGQLFNEIPLALTSLLLRQSKPNSEISALLSYWIFMSQAVMSSAKVTDTFDKMQNLESVNKQIVEEMEATLERFQSMMQNDDETS